MSFVHGFAAAAFPVARPPATGPNLEKITFYKPDILASFGFNPDIVRVAPKLEFYNQKTGKFFGQCTGVVVSDQGDTFTAGHCVEDCLATAGAYQMEDEQLNVVKSKLPDVRCDVAVNGVRMQARVLAASDCAGNSKFDSRNPWGRCLGLDYALLEFEKVGLPVCAAIGEGKLGLPVFMIGSGEKTYRFTDRNFPPNSDETTAVSEGKIIPAQADCEFQDRAPNERGENTKIPFTSAYVAKSGLQNVSAGRVFQTTVDGVHGFSGSGLFAKDSGLVVGLGDGGDQNNSKFFECVGATFFVNFNMILKDIRDHYPDLSLSPHTSCLKNKIAKNSP